MSERAAFAVLVFGVILTLASLLGLSAVAITQGWLSLPDLSQVASTPYTSVGWAVGIWMISGGVWLLALLLRRRSQTSLYPPKGPVASVPSSGRDRPTQVLRAVEVTRRSRADAPTAVIPLAVGARVAGVCGGRRQPPAGTVGGGGGVARSSQAWAAAGRDIYPQIGTAAGVSGGGPGETNRITRKDR